MNDHELVSEALGTVVALGGQPTARELELAEAVADHIANRSRAETKHQEGEP